MKRASQIVIAAAGATAAWFALGPKIRRAIRGSQPPATPERLDQLEARLGEIDRRLAAVPAPSAAEAEGLGPGKRDIHGEPVTLDSIESPTEAAIVEAEVDGLPAGEEDSPAAEDIEWAIDQAEAESEAAAVDQMWEPEPQAPGLEAGAAVAAAAEVWSPAEPYAESAGAPVGDQPEAGATSAADAPQPPEQELVALTGQTPVAGFEPATRAPESYLDEGNVYFGVGQYGLAVDRYTRALSVREDYGAAYYNRANARMRLGELDPAEEDYSSALRLMPDDADVLNNRGMLRLRKEDIEGARDDFARAVGLRPADVTIRTNHGLTLMRLNRPGDALAEFSTALTNDPEDAGARYGAAAALSALSRHDEALEQLRYAVFVDPEYAGEAAVDPAFDPLRGNDDFNRILRHAHDRMSSR
jgi:tetratricopeptide (TPR) repeat protein